MWMGLEMDPTNLLLTYFPIINKYGIWDLGKTFSLKNEELRSPPTMRIRITNYYLITVLFVFTLAVEVVVTGLNCKVL
jgi:hypothetical protein